MYDYVCLFCEEEYEFCCDSVYDLPCPECYSLLIRNVLVPVADAPTKV